MTTPKSTSGGCLVALVALAASCGGPSAPDATVRMDFLRGGGLFDAPFPAADLVHADGTVAVEHLPNGGRITIIEQIRTALTGARGFGTTSAVHFPLTATPDTSMLPARVAADDTSAVVQLVDVDPDSP